MKINGLKIVIQKLLLFPLLIFGLISSCSPAFDRQISNSKRNSQSVKLIVSAAASMQDVLKEIRGLYLEQYPHADLTFNFGSSGSLQHQIEQGAPVDIFISAAPQQMNDLAAKELLIGETRQDLVENHLVLIVPEDDKSTVDFNGLTKKSIERVALGEPNSVPAGKYAQEILTNLNLAKQIESKIVYGKDVRQVLNYVATGNIDAGIVYRTDTVNTKKVRVVSTASSADHSPIVYPVAALKNSQHPQAAKQMLKFFFTPQAQAVFRKHGFVSGKDRQNADRIDERNRQLAISKH